MSARAVVAVASRDLLLVRRNGAVLLPLLVVPLVLLILLPVGGGVALRLAGEAALREAAADIPADVLGRFGTDLREQIATFFFVYAMSALYLILPLMTANVIAADSFAGEKERGTLEPLLYTPTSDAELFAGKVLAAWVPAVAVAWVGAAVYWLAVDLALGQLLLPNVLWALLCLWVAPPVAAVGLAVMVLVSRRAQTFQGASQVGGTIVIPAVLLVVAQLSGIVLLSPSVVVLAGALLWALAAGLIAFGARTFRRTRLLAGS